jgi:hypothetical protein
MLKYVLGLFFLLLVGCASVQGASRVADFEEVSSAYEKAIRWKRYDVARGFIQKGKSDHGEPNGEVLSKIKVTSYDLVHRSISEDKRMVKQTVKIEYHYTDELIERILVDIQLWGYDETQERWYLESGLPDFRRNRQPR